MELRFRSCFPKSVCTFYSIRVKFPRQLIKLHYRNFRNIFLRLERVILEEEARIVKLSSDRYH